jgi:hypothetical protein
VLRFDELTHATRTFTIPEHAGLAGLVEKRKQTLWLLDSEGATLAPMNPRSGATGQPIGLSGQPQQGVIAFGGIWAAAGRVVASQRIRAVARSGSAATLARRRCSGAFDGRLPASERGGHRPCCAYGWYCSSTDWTVSIRTRIQKRRLGVVDFASFATVVLVEHVACVRTVTCAPAGTRKVNSLCVSSRV